MGLFLFLQFLRGLSVIHITFWFDADSTIKLFSFFLTFVERRISGLGEDFGFSSISLTNLLSNS